MPASPYAKLLVSVNGGTAGTGTIHCAVGDTIQLSSESVSQQKTLYELLAYYPDTMAAPAGWTKASNGVIFYVGLVPPQFTVSAWGKFRPRLTVEDGRSAGVPDSTRVDTSTKIACASPNGLQDLAYGEEGDWSSDQRANLRAIDASLGGAGSQGTGTTVGVQTTDLFTYAIPDNSVVDASATFVAGDPAQPTKTWRQTRTITLARTGGGAPVVDVADAGPTASGTLTGAAASIAVSGNNIVPRGIGSTGGRTLKWRVALVPLIVSVTPTGGISPTLAFYSDVPSSITSSGEFISVWGSASGVVGTPRIVTDPIGAGLVVRTSTADKIQTSAGAADFISNGPCTLLFACRYRTDLTNTIIPLLDTTENGTRQGVQVQIGDQGLNIFYGRSISVRVFDGSTWSFDAISLPTTIFSGAFIPLKTQIVSIRLSDTHLDVRVDGESVKSGGSSITRTYLTGTSGKLSIGGSASDYFAIEGYNSILSDAANAAAEARLAARFGAHLSHLLEGDPLYTDTTNSSAFPWICKLPNGHLYATVYNGQESVGPTSTDHNDAFTSSDGGLTWSGPTVLTTSGSGTLYSDLKTSEVLADGSMIQVTMTYDVSLAFKNVIQRRATTYNVDGTPIWPGTWTDILTGVPHYSATQCAPVEDPTTPGTMHMAVWTQEGSSDAHTSIWDYVTTNAGATWARHIIANGMTDSRTYDETGIWFQGSEVNALIREDTTSGSPMVESHSTDHGVTWSAPAAVNLPGHSSGQQVKVLASGRRVWLGRRTSSSVKGAIFWKASGAAWNANWSSSALEFDPLFGGFYYGGIYETSPGKLLLIAARTTGVVLNVATYQIDEWALPGVLAMPGTVTPPTFSITVSTTQQIAATGAGDFTYAVTGTSGGTISGSGLYTAGASNGTDTITVTDLNGHVVGTSVGTITGASTINPTAISGANGVYRADHATNTGDTTPVTAWNDETSTRNMTQPTSTSRFTYAASGINSKPDVISHPALVATGMFADQAALGTSALTLAACVSWTSSITDTFIYGSRYNAYHYHLGNDTVNPGQFVFVVVTSVTGMVTIKSNSTTLNDGLRHTVVGTYDGTTVKMYVDGVLQTMTASATGTIDVPSTTLDNNSIGAAVDHTNAPGNSWVGHIKGCNSASTAVSAGVAAQLHAWYATI